MAVSGDISDEDRTGYKALFENVTVAILVVKLDREINMVNPFAEKLFGYERDELSGAMLEILVPESFRETHIRHHFEYFSLPHPRPMAHGEEVLARRKDGSVFPAEISLCSYHVDDEMRVVAFVTDVSERKKAKAALEKLNEELEERIRERTQELISALEHEKEVNELKSRFVSTASHEFRTPLSVILSSAKLIESYVKMEDEAKRKKHIERIETAVRNLTEILNDFLSLDKLEQGKLIPFPQTFDLNVLVRDVAAEMGALLKKGQEIRLVCQGAAEVSQDKKVLRNIMVNLLSNAIKYSGEDKKIFLSLETDSKITILVRDEGIGIPPEEQTYIFSKFYRATNAEGIPGTGLGLTIVKKYAELLDGNIRFTSELNGGTTFTAEFPRVLKIAARGTAMG